LPATSLNNSEQPPVPSCCIDTLAYHLFSKGSCGWSLCVLDQRQ
jgi:hypothetical protein